MNYFVIWPDGRRFGPADLAMLNAWAREGRLIPASQLEEAGTGRRFAAHELPGLAFPSAGLNPAQQWPVQQPGPGQPGPGRPASQWSQPQAPFQQPGNPQGPFSGPAQPQGPYAGPAQPQGPFSHPTQQHGPGSGPLPGYYRPQYGSYSPQSSGNLTAAWILGGVSIFAIFLCCCSSGMLSLIGVASGVIGMVLAHRAKLEGQRSAQAAWIFNLVGTILCCLAVVGGIVLMSFMASGGFGQQ